MLEHDFFRKPVPTFRDHATARDGTPQYLIELQAIDHTRRRLERPVLPCGGAYGLSVVYAAKMITWPHPCEPLLKHGEIRCFRCWRHSRSSACAASASLEPIARTKRLRRPGRPITACISFCPAPPTSCNMRSRIRARSLSPSVPAASPGSWRI